MHVCTQAGTCVKNQALAWKCVCANVQKCKSANVQMCKRATVCMSVCVYVCMCVRVYVCMQAGMYVYNPSARLEVRRCGDNGGRHHRGEGGAQDGLVRQIGQETPAVGSKEIVT